MKKTTASLLKALLGSTIVAALFDPLADRAQGFVQRVVSDMQGAATGFTRELIEMLVVAVLGFVGVIFILSGLALFLETEVGVPGAGFGYVGVGIVFFSLVTILVMRYHNHKNK
jgi:peptidoglycan/LPS O-acetylase OafA/YrhL